MMRTFEEVDAFIGEELRSLSAMHITERRALFDICQEVPMRGLVVEVGCQLGCSSVIISLVGYEKRYRTIHIDPYTQQPEYLAGWSNSMMSLTQRWSGNHTFTLLCMKTEQAEWHLSKLLSDGLDLAFIDGDHMKAGVETDLKFVASKIRQGGYLAAHDYTEWKFPGVAEAIDPFVAEGWEKVGQYFSMGIWRKL